MDIWLVTFKDKGNCEIDQVSVQCANCVFAAVAARLKILKDKGTRAVSVIDRETDWVVIEKLT